MALEGQCNAADAVWSVLRASGTNVCFLNPGTSELWLVSALSGSGLLPVLCLHESVCAGAADGYARISGSVGCTLLHLGVGCANALSNLHNAASARSPVVNIVGQMSTFHQGKGALLERPDPATILQPVCAHVARVTSARDTPSCVLEALQSVSAESSMVLSTTSDQTRVSGVVVPHDVQWTRLSSDISGEACRALQSNVSSQPNGLSSAVVHFVQQCAHSLLQGTGVAFLLGGRALIADGTLQAVGNAADVLGATLFTQSAFSRVDRGFGRPKVHRLPYFPHDIRNQLNKFDKVVLIDSAKPVAPFGYPNEEGKDAFPFDDDNDDNDCVWSLDCEDALLLSQELAFWLKQYKTGTMPEDIAATNEARPSLPSESTSLTAHSMCQTIAALQPEDCIIVDESLTSGTHYWQLSHGCPPFTHLGLSGGSIGDGPPLALGASLANTNRRVIALQADGSALYSLQALWSQVRHQLPIVTVIANNRSYQILKLELSMQGVPSPGGATSSNATQIDGIDFCKLAAGYGASSSRATTCEELVQQLRACIEQQFEGPHLIDACLHV